MAESDLMPAIPGYTRTSDGTRISLADIIHSVHDTDQIISDNIQVREFRRGNAFAAGYVWTDVDSEATKALLLVTGTNPIMVAYKAGGTALTDYGVYNSPTITGNGTALITLHRNKIVSFTPTATAYYDPTYSALGNIEIPHFLGTSGNIISRSGEEKLAQAALIPPSSNVIFSITNSADAAQERMSIALEWFETDWLV